VAPSVAATTKNHSTMSVDPFWSIYSNTVVLAKLDERDYIIRGGPRKVLPMFPDNPVTHHLIPVAHRHHTPGASLQAVVSAACAPRRCLSARSTGSIA